MMEELNTARGLLNTALDRYINACSAIRDHCDSKTTPDDLQLVWLVDCAADELLWFKSYDSKLNRARAAVSVARNCSSTLVPIHSLPSEIIADIFQLVVNSQACFGNQVLSYRPKYRSQEPGFPDYPDQLLTVCHRWRQIAFESATLWSHIDILRSHPFSRRLFNRAKAYSHQVDHSLLDIHLVDNRSTSPDCTDVIPFLHSIATRIRSLELVISNANSRIPKAILHICLAHCVPGTFRAIRIKQSRFHTPKFIGAAKNSPYPKPSPPDSDSESFDPYPETLLLDIPEDSLEALWSHITSLRLCNLYPYWTSKAYHGLTELHLFPESRSSSDQVLISESQLVRILVSSPMLRALHFNLEITEPISTTSLVTPVPLNDLRTLNVSMLPYGQLEIFLRWLAPGSAPLQFSIELPRPSEWTEFGPRDELHRFLARSTVSDLCLNLLYAHFSQAYELIRLTPSLRVLILINVACDSGDYTPGVDPGTENIQTPSQLDHLYMLEGMLDFNTVQILGQIVSERAARKFTLWDCSYYHTMNSYSDEQALKESISRMHPTARLFTQHEPNPLAGWDIIA